MAASSHTMDAEQPVHQRRLQRVQQHLQPSSHSSSPTPHLVPSATSSPFLSNLHRHIVLSPAVQAALLARAPIIALESTIITHGMKFSENYHTALRVQQVASSLSVTPATIAVLAGRIHVGLTDEQIEQLARRGTACRKCSRRELPLVIAESGWGSTTVAATMFIAHAVGIRVFATGGIGGVHRGGESTMDVSADLDELAHTAVTVVCAGVKSILDIPRTVSHAARAHRPFVAHCLIKRWLTVLNADVLCLGVARGVGDSISSCYHSVQRPVAHLPRLLFCFQRLRLAVRTAVDSSHRGAGAA